MLGFGQPLGDFLKFSLQFQTSYTIFHYIQKQPPEGFYKKSVLKYFAKFTGKQMCQSLFFKKGNLAQVLSREFYEIFKNTFFTKHQHLRAAGRIISAFSFQECTHENVLIILVANKLDLNHKRSIANSKGAQLASVCCYVDQKLFYGCLTIPQQQRGNCLYNSIKILALNA